MDAALGEVEDVQDPGVSARRSHFHSDYRALERPASTNRWVTAGEEPPFRITASGQIIPLEGDLYPP